MREVFLNDIMAYAEYLVREPGEDVGYSLASFHSHGLHEANCQPHREVGHDINDRLA